MSRRKQAKPRSVKAVEEGESSEFAGTWESSSAHTDVPGPDGDADPKECRGGLEDGEQSVTSQDERMADDDLDDEPIFTCDNCQRDFECLAELTEHRTNHCPRR
ncbi:zinc finger protein 423-like [Brienomyrus brachyistius]|uniref:zinc finger protein 423-like n=1 Tax=Brienomyrus brachyistius TaxID=42636 RepID=UPI0020B31E2F|nr:zinc finger protein 423-like [Brienomyrus brachyistius]